MRKPDPALVVRSAVLAAVTLTGLATAACRPAASDEGAPAASSPGAGASTSTASPHGLDVAAIDRSVNPGDDFYKFANGAWLEKTEIPADRSTWGPSEAMTEEAARPPASSSRRPAGRLRPRGPSVSRPPTTT